jgi:hypothetical protein
LSANPPPGIGGSVTGDVVIRDFDRGVIETMGGTIVNDDYFILVEGVVPPPYPLDYRDQALCGKQMPGIPIIWASPDDRFESWVLPCLVVRRESIDPASERWPSFYQKYRAPATDATALQVTRGTQTFNGYDKYEQQQGHFPYDITYVINVLSAGEKPESDVQRMLLHVLRFYPPKDSLVEVRDSLGDERTYEVFSEGPVNLAEALDIVDKQAGYSVNIKVKGELDLRDPVVKESNRSQTFTYGMR